MKRRRYSRRRWQQWLGAHARSNQSIGQFCIERDLPENSFYRWRKTLDLESPSLHNALLEPNNQFVQVKMATPLTTAIEFRLPCGAVIRSPADPTSLKPLLEVLLQRQSCEKIERPAMSNKARQL